MPQDTRGHAIVTVPDREARCGVTARLTAVPTPHHTPGPSTNTAFVLFSAPANRFSRKRC